MSESPRPYDYQGRQRQVVARKPPTEEQLSKGIPGDPILEGEAGYHILNIPGENVDVPDQTPTLAQKMVARFWGTDIANDPQQWPRLATIITGAIAGSAAGSRFPLSPLAGAVAGGVVGAAGGAVMPEVVMDVAEKIGVVPPGFRARHGLSDKDLQTVMEGEALLELATGGGISAVRLLGRATARGVTGVGRKGGQLAEDAAKEGIQLLPVQVGNRRLPRAFVSVLGRFPLFAGPLVRQGRKTEKQLAEAFSSLPGRIGPVADASEVSASILNDAHGVVDEINQQFEKKFHDLYVKADQLGVTVTPRASLDKANEILNEISKASVISPGKGLGPAPKPLADLRKFIQDNISAMATVDANGNKVTAKQTMQRLDSLVTAIDDKIAAARKSKNKVVIDDLVQIRQAVLMDMLQNSSSADPVATKAILNEFRTLDDQFSYTVQELFENGATKRFGNYGRKGVRGIQFSENNVPVDNIGDVVLRGDSPSVIVDLSKVVTKSTFNKVASYVIDQRIADAMVEGAQGSTLDIAKFAKSLGIGNKASNRYRQMSELMSRTGGLTMPEVEKLLEVSKAVGSVEIPNVSTFVARRAVMGGLATVGSALTGGLAGYATGGGTALGGLSGVVLATLTIGGSRLFSKMISNPTSARLLRRSILRAGPGEFAEAATIADRAALTRAARAALWSMTGDERQQFFDDMGYKAGTTIGEVDSYLTQTIDVLFNAMKRVGSGGGGGGGG